MSGSIERETEDSQWELVVTSTFDEGYTSKDTVNKHRVDNALADLSRSDDPRRLGIPKPTPDGQVYVYEIGHKYRLSYRVDMKNRTLELIRVCDHKTVYGRD